MASWRPNAAASAYQSGDSQGPPGLARQTSIARYDSASSEAFQQYSTVDPLTGLPPQPGAPMHAQPRCYDSGLDGMPPVLSTVSQSSLTHTPSLTECRRAALGLLKRPQRSQPCCMLQVLQQSGR